MKHVKHFFQMFLFLVSIVAGVGCLVGGLVYLGIFFGPIAIALALLGLVFVVTSVWFAWDMRHAD